MIKIGALCDNRNHDSWVETKHVAITPTKHLIFFIYNTWRYSICQIIFALYALYATNLLKIMKQ